MTAPVLVSWAGHLTPEGKAVADWLNLNVGWTLYYARFELNEGSAALLLQGPGIGFGIPLF